MKILINDLMQYSDLPEDLRSPSLADRYPNSGILTVNFTIPDAYATFDIFSGLLSQPLSVNNVTVIDGILNQPQYDGQYDGVLSQPLSVLGADEFDCIGFGGTDATEVTINSDITVHSGGGAFDSGLYELGEIVKANQITIEHNGTYMGRIAVGQCIEICESPTREPGFFTSNKRRVSVSGAVVPSAGGYGGRKIGVDFRYKFTESILTEIERAYYTQIMKGFPFFCNFDNDYQLFDHFYGYTDLDYIFQSSLKRQLYSKRLEFTEAF